MAKPIIELLTTLTNVISKIENKDDFEITLDQFGFYKFQVYKKDNFSDFPYPNLNVTRKNNFSSYSYLYEIYPENIISSPIIKILFIDSIHGPFILIDIFNQNVLKQLKSQLELSDKLKYEREKDTFQDKELGGFLHFTYYPSMHLTAVMIARNIIFFKHPFYSYNKVADFFSAK
jgi:hypothetical protein